MNQLVQVERVDLASVHLREAFADVVEEEMQLLLVILADQLTRRTTTCLFVLDISDPDTIGHTRNLRRNKKTPLCGAFEVGRGGLEPPTLGLRVPCSTS